MYLDTGTMISIIIALVVGMLTIGYSIYIIKTQNEIIQRMSDVSATRRKMERQIAMRTKEELLKIKEAFAYAMIDMLDVFDELIATNRVYVEDEPTINDLAKSEAESK